MKKTNPELELELEELEAEFARSETMTIELYTARKEETYARSLAKKKEELARKKQANTPADESVDEQFVSGAMLKRVLLNAGAAMREEITKAVAPLQQRCATLEARCKDLERRSGGVSITANGLTMQVPGMEHVAGVIERLDATLNKPVVPELDKDGNLIGVRRVSTLQDPKRGNGKVS